MNDEERLYLRKKQRRGDKFTHEDFVLLMSDTYENLGYNKDKSKELAEKEIQELKESGLW